MIKTGFAVKLNKFIFLSKDQRTKKKAADPNKGSNQQ